MSQHNYTPIDEIVKKYEEEIEKYSATIESEPIQEEPPIHGAEYSEMKQVVEHEPDKEVEKHVRKRHEKVRLDKELKGAGVETTEHIKFQQYDDIKLPISDENVLKGLHKPISSSWRWLSTLAVYILKKAHLTLKKVGGKIIRVKT